MVLSNHDVMASACGANEESSVGVITRLNGALQFHSQVETFFWFVCDLFLLGEIAQQH